MDREAVLTAGHPVVCSAIVSVPQDARLLRVQVLQFFVGKGFFRPRQEGTGVDIPLARD